MRHRLTGFMLAFVIALGIASLATAQPVQFSQAGGISSSTADSTYLRLDTSNDPLTGALEIPAGTSGAPALTFTGFTGVAGIYADPSGVRTKASLIADTSFTQNNAAGSTDLRGPVRNGGAANGGQLYIDDVAGTRTASGIWTSSVATGGVAHLFDTTTAFGTGKLFQVANNGNELFSVTTTAVDVRTTSGLIFTGGQASIIASSGYTAAASSANAWLRQTQATVGDARVGGYEDAVGEIGVRLGSIRSDGESGDLGYLAAFATDIDGTPSDKAFVHGSGSFRATGTPGAPAFSFPTDDDNGMYLATTNTIGWSTGAVYRMGLDSTGLSVVGNVQVTGDVRSAAGSVSDPAFQIVGDANTGIYSPAADIVGVTGGGTLQAAFGTSGAWSLPGMEANGVVAGAVVQTIAQTPAATTCNAARVGSIATYDDGADSQTCVCTRRGTSTFAWLTLDASTCTHF